MINYKNDYVKYIYILRYIIINIIYDI